MKLKCIIAGSREGFSYADVVKALADCGFVKEITEVVSGGARGVDRFLGAVGQLQRSSCEAIYP